MDGKAVTLMIRFKNADGTWKRRPAARGANGRVKPGHALIGGEVIAVSASTYDLSYPFFASGRCWLRALKRKPRDPSIMVELSDFNPRVLHAKISSRSVASRKDTAPVEAR